MKIEDKPKIQLPLDMDEECIEICDTLNRLPNTKTTESCSGHGKHTFWIFFKCYDIDVITRLGRAVDKRYSDGNWEIVVDDTDVSPRGRFWLRALHMYDVETMKESVKKLIENIIYWFDDKFDEHFNS